MASSNYIWPHQFFLSFKELESTYTRQSAGACISPVVQTAKVQKFCLYTGGELRISSIQKDAKPVNDQMGKAFESYPGIPVSGKTGQRMMLMHHFLLIKDRNVTKNFLRDTRRGNSVKR